MKILVLGAGAVGLSVAAKLSSVAEVHAVCRPRHADAIERRGFRMTGIWGEGTHSFQTWTSEPKGIEFDTCLIACKGPDTRRLCSAFAETIRGRPTASLQNGIGNEEIIADFTDRVIGGTVITGFVWTGDAAVDVTVEAGPVMLGAFPEGEDPMAEALASLLRKTGVKAEATVAIRSALWAKTLYNCALNPLGAVFRVPYGALAESSAWAIIEDVIAEAFRVIAAEGASVPWATAEDYLAHLRDAQLPATAGHRSSMLQDLEAGKGTEIDFMNGAVAARGAAHGVATPVNAMLANLIKFQESLSVRPKTC